MDMAAASWARRAEVWKARVATLVEGRKAARMAGVAMREYMATAVYYGRSMRKGRKRKATTGRWEETKVSNRS
jgi:hypothetical protein